MSESKMTLVFEGSAVENGEIDVQDLAPALLSLGELIKAANHEINGDRTQISIKMRAVSEGSFEVDLVSIQSIIEQAKGLWDLLSDNSDKIATANEIFDLLFNIKTLSGIAVGGGLFALKKFMKGKKPDKIEHIGGDVHIYKGDIYFITNSKIINLEKNQIVGKQARKFVSSLSNEGIENIKIRRPDTEDLSVRKEDIEYFENKESDENLLDTTREINLQIINLSFKENNQWRVTDGDASFNVAIEDVDFLDRIASNDISFSKGDFLNCLVREKQMRNSDGLKIKRSIIKVKGHQPANRQSKLL
ncbi:MAG: hypothetical protein ISN28_09750 [Ectothiorhodospiraceae bacterium AqS1]|nr:hypothetical protein [Ectothiorhodospiraceae bacterium AqS1]